MDDKKASSAPSTVASLMDPFEQETDNEDNDDDEKRKEPRRLTCSAAASIFPMLEWGWPTPPLVVPPSHLPDPAALLRFDVDEKKNEIFEAAREQIRNKAQYTKRVSSYSFIGRALFFVTHIFQKIFAQQHLHGLSVIFVSSLPLYRTMKGEEALDADHDRPSHQSGHVR